MEKYDIKIQNNDFVVLDKNINIKGTRQKKIVIDKFGDTAMFKYQSIERLTTEACSEKICYELAVKLGYRCARIELAKDEDNIFGVLNYLFSDLVNYEHMDASSYLTKNEYERSKFYTISNIKEVLDNLDKKLFKEFIKILIFDALVGEQDRHEDNWGIEIINSKFLISPLYDNGCSLLKDFGNEEYANKYYSGKKNFDDYIRRSKTYIYKEDNKTRYKHFELIEYLNENFYDEVQTEINNLNKLSDKDIETIVNKIPDVLLTDKHKKYIIMYLKKRKEILLEIK